MNTRTLIVNLWAIAVLATAAICITVAVSVREAEMMNAKREAYLRASEEIRRYEQSHGSTTRLPGLEAMNTFRDQEELFR